ncbi:MAG TPA: protein-disulfide reductase DsbD domain-containing protein [Candidatus Limnocylindria bacterium]|jgi:hypothetical protein|nr:protein-disulfide reductase DsbD domain-containing protein [Candidatus Limnocylindria bacterium]
MQLIPARCRRWLPLLLLGLVTGVSAQAHRASPFRVTPALVSTDTGWDLTVDFDFPARHYLYADRLAFTIEGVPGSPHFQLPPPTPPTGGERQPQFRQHFTARSCQTGRPPQPLVLSVFLHGCDPENCYFPEVRRFRLTPGADAVELPSDLAGRAPPEPPRWRLVADGFSVATRTDFTNEADFQQFIQPGGAAEVTAPPVRHAGIPWWLAGGMAAAALGWTTTRSGRGRRWPALVIAGALGVLGLLSYRQSAVRAGQPEALITLNFAANSVAEEDLADLLSRAWSDGSSVLLSLQPAGANSRPADVWAGGAGRGRLAGLRPVRVQLPAVADPRSRELCEYFAVAQPPVFALLRPRPQIPAGMAPKLHPGDRPMPPR